MKITSSNIWSDINKIRKTAPLVHNITNYVVMNSTANALLSLGASPVMAHAEQEVEQMVKLAGALVINIGTLSDHWIVAMVKAGHQAKKQNIPVILDPVGAGATEYRTLTARKLIQEISPAIIRGNASEIMAVLAENAKTRGVDSIAASYSAVEAARRLSRTYGSVICISGATDYIVVGENVLKVKNGHPMMARITGMGCTATALCGAFAAVNKSFALAAAHAMAVMGIAGEIAVKDSRGPGALQSHFLDALYNLSERDLSIYLKT